MSQKTYHVLRQHLGDRDYFPGDTRDAAPSDVEHLVRLGVLSLDAPEPKAGKAAPAKKSAPKK